MGLMDKVNENVKKGLDAVDKVKENENIKKSVDFVDKKIEDEKQKREERKKEEIIKKQEKEKSQAIIIENTKVKEAFFNAKQEEYVHDAKLADKVYKAYITDGLSRIEKVNGRFLASQTIKMDVLIEQNNEIIRLLKKVAGEEINPVCSNCGREYEEGTNFCKNCGTEL